MGDDMRLENPAFDYDAFGQRYAAIRQTDPTIAKYILSALGDAQTVINVGAGAGSYEPGDRYVVAVEPSSTMRAQRLERGLAPALDGRADALPFDSNSFDASMAMVTVHHWPDIQKGLNELRRVASRRVLVMTFDPLALDRFWNAAYFPEVIAVEKMRYPSIEFLVECLGSQVEVISIPIPKDCIDGFQEAFYARPEAFLRKEVRRAQSAWGFIDADTEQRLVERLAVDLKSGRWDELYSEQRNLPFFEGALRLLVAS